MDDYATKPLRPGPLRDLLLTWGAGTRGLATAVDESPKPLKSSHLITKILRQACGDDPGITRDMLTFMIETASSQLKELKAAVASEDVGQVNRAAHTLKGTFAAGARCAPGTCDLLMTLGNSGELSAIGAAHRKIDDQWDEFQIVVNRCLDALAVPAV